MLVQRIGPPDVVLITEMPAPDVASAACTTLFAITVPLIVFPVPFSFEKRIETPVEADRGLFTMLFVITQTSSASVAEVSG